MKRQPKAEFTSDLKLDGFHPNNPISPVKPEEQLEDEVDNSDTEYSQSDETLDMAILQELIKDEEKSLELLIKDNDRAVDYILTGNIPNAVSILEKMEKLMEYLAANGKTLDRNIIIVCLYNISASHQAGWALDKCAKYLEGVTFNLSQSIKHNEMAMKALHPKGPDDPQVLNLKAINLRKKQFLIKVYLQYCAVSSQLNKHEEAFFVAQKAQQIMCSVAQECLNYCKETTKDSECEYRVNHTPQKNSDRSRMTTISGGSIDIRKSLLNDITFRDEVYYNRQIVEYATPYLEDFLKSTQNFTIGKMHELITHTRNLLFNWKNNPENNEKYIRKELTKDKVPNKITEENRTLLGVQQDPEWLTTLNIGSIMHMRPLKYKDYAQKREFINELSKTSLQEKAIFQSLSLFTMATEMRFLEMHPEIANEGQANMKDGKVRQGSYKSSEAYHLKAIETVCRYITGPCPYIHHLITSYQKHYGQDLETIPEESVYSDSSAGRDVRRDEQVRFLTEQMEHDNQAPLLKLQAVHADAKKTLKRSPASRERSKGSQVEYRIPLVKFEEDRYKEMRRDRKKESFKSMNIRSKKLRSKPDGIRKAYTTDISASSPFRASRTEISNHSPKSHKASSSRFDTDFLASIEEKKNSKKSSHIPSLGLQNVFLKELSPQNVATKHFPNDAVGFRSERAVPNQSSESQSQFHSLEPERKKGASASETNFYLYKNFNKFIQNFYVKNEQATQQKFVEEKIKEKYMNHPYQKEQLQPKAKKLQLPKKATSATLKKIPQAKTPTLLRAQAPIQMERATLGDEIKIIENKRPKSGLKRPIDGINHPRVNSAHYKVNEKLAKSFSTKEFDPIKHYNSVRKKE